MSVGGVVGIEGFSFVVRSLDGSTLGIYNNLIGFVIFICLHSGTSFLSWPGPRVSRMGGCLYLASPPFSHPISHTTTPEI